MSGFTSYSDTLKFMFQQLPMFQNIGKDAFKKDLTNTLALLNAIGNPHLNQKWIHVAGTNGKGSVSSMLAATLTAHGYKTRVYGVTSRQYENQIRTFLKIYITPFIIALQILPS